MKLLRLLAVLCCASALGATTGKKISDYTETLAITDSWIYEIAVPGVTNYRVTFGTIATNIIARAGGGAIITASNGLFAVETTRNAAVSNAVVALISAAAVSPPISSVQFNSNGVIQGSAGFVFTNGNLGIGTAVATSRLLIKGADSTSAFSGLNVTDSADTPILFVRNDGKVGVGTGNPLALFNVAGEQRNTPNLNFPAGLLVINSSTGSIAMSAIKAARPDGMAVWIGAAGPTTTGLAAVGIATNEAGLFSDSGLPGLIIENTTPGGYIRFQKAAVEVARFDANGHFIPGANATYNFGSLSNQWLGLWVNDVTLGGATPTIITDTLDATDSKSLVLNGGGSASVNRGAEIDIFGNEHAAQAGQLVLYAGNVASGDFILATTPYGAAQTVTLKATTGNFGLGTATPSSPLHVQATGSGNKTNLTIGRNTGNVGDALSTVWNQADLGNLAQMDVIVTLGGAGSDIAFQTRTSSALSERVRILSSGNVGIGTNAPGYKLEVNGDARITGAVMLNNGSPAAGQVATFRSDGTIYPSNVVAGATTQMVAAAIGTLTVTNALSVDVLNATQVNLANPLGSNVVRLGIQDLTNSAAMSPANGDALTWNSGMKKWTNSIPAGADVVSNITVSSTANVLLDFGAANVFKIRLLTNWSQSFTNTSLLTKKAYVYYQQDTNGTRLLTGYNVAGGLLQTNANMQPTTNASALDLLEVMPGFFTTNLVAYWPQNFLPRVNFTNSITAFATASDTFTRANADPISNPMSDGVSTWTSGPGALGPMKIESNVALRSGAGDSGMRVLAPTFTGNHKATITLDVDVGAVGPMVRMQGTGDASGYLLISDDTTHVLFYKVTDTGTLANTPLGSPMETELLEPGDTISISANGTTLEAFVNGVSVGTTTDATWSGGQPGAWVTSATATVENFVSTDL